MEVQIPQQSVQINLNNKIITLHNVTIVKNPRIVKVDAAQYSNLLLKSANGPIKFVTNGTTSMPLKLPMPSLVPMQKISTASPFKITNATVPVQTPVIQTVIRQQHHQSPHIINGIVPQLKPTFISTVTATPAAKIQTLPVKSQPSVIISPPKSASVSSVLPASQTPVISKPVLASPQPAIQIYNASPPILPIQTKVIVSPSSTKRDAIDEQPPSPKKSKLEFRCMFCVETFFDDPQLLYDHMRARHPDKIPSEKKDEIISEKLESSSSSSSSSDSDSSDSSSDQESTSDDEGAMSCEDDDASEVNDLINDLERSDDSTQDTRASSQERSNTPESPEFEQHVPSEQNVEIPSEIKEEFGDDDYEWDCKLTKTLLYMITSLS